jgi:hypothetical protein
MVDYFWYSIELLLFGMSIVYQVSQTLAGTMDNQVQGPSTVLVVHDKTR